MLDLALQAGLYYIPEAEVVIECLNSNIYIDIYVEKVKQKTNMFDGLFICQCVSTSIFLECKNVLSKLS